MKQLQILSLAVVLLASPAGANGNYGCDGNDQYYNLGVLYVDDHLDNPSSQAANTFPAPYVYAETNGVGGLQRVAPSESPAAKPAALGSSDGSGHCGYTAAEPDQWVL